MIPTPGRIVLYNISELDAESTNKRRLDARMHLGVHQANSNGVQIHVGNHLTAGDVFPMIITKVWDAGNPAARVNGQVFLDGNDLLWVTSATAGTGQHDYAWPVRTPELDVVIG